VWQRPRIGGAVMVEVAIVSLALAVALFIPWGGGGSAAERLLDAMRDFWLGLARVVAVL
jgi:hypothetical protein